MPATSEKQKRFMQAVANNPKFAKQVGVPQSVGKEFTMKKYQDGKAVKKEEKLSPGDAADKAAMKDFGNESFLRPPKEGPKAGTYKGSTKKKDEGKVIKNAKPRSATDRFVGKPTSKEEQELEDLHRSYSSKGRNRKSATQKFIDLGNKGGGAVKKYAGGGKVRGYGMARGGRACKMV